MPGGRVGVNSHPEAEAAPAPVRPPQTYSLPYAQAADTPARGPPGSVGIRSHWSVTVSYASRASATIEVPRAPHDHPARDRLNGRLPEGPPDPIPEG